MPEVKYVYTNLDWRTKSAVSLVTPYTDVSFDTALEGGGVFSGTLKLEQSADILLDATIPTRRLVMAERHTSQDGVVVDRKLVWLGMIWTRTWDSVNKTLQIHAGTIDTYFSRRSVRDFLQWTGGTDQLDIARALIQYAQTTAAGSAGDLGVLTPSVTPSGVTPTVKFLPEEPIKIIDALKQLGGAENGFDYRFDAVLGPNGDPVITFALGYPYIGAPYVGTPLVFEYPGNVISYSEPEDATDMATWVRGVGSVGASTPMVDVHNQALEDADYPALDTVNSYSDVDDAATLAFYVNDDARRLGGVITVDNLVVRGDLDPSLGTYNVGDWAQLYVKDLKHPQGASAMVRIVKIAVKPASNDAAEAITLTVDSAAP